jgi:hypothetical protein
MSNEVLLASIKDYLSINLGRLKNIMKGTTHDGL